MDCRDTGNRREVYGGLPYLRAVFSFTSIIPNSYVAHFVFEHVTRPPAPHRHVLHPSVAGNLCPILYSFMLYLQTAIVKQWI